LQDAPKFTQIGSFLFENMPSGNHVTASHSLFQSFLSFLPSIFCPFFLCLSFYAPSAVPFTFRLCNQGCQIILATTS
jgi:hypothetical protein